MAKIAKRLKEIRAAVDKTKQYDVKAGFELLKSTAKAKFVESVDVSIQLGIDATKSDQNVRGATVLPHGTGKTVRVLVFTQGELADQAKAAGADFVGAEDMVTKILSQNWFGFDVCVTTPDMMPVIGRIAKVLGPKGLMPNPKSGTVTMDVTKAINDIKSGKVEYRLDKTNIIHLGFGKVSFGTVRSTFVIDENGIIEKVMPKVKPDTNAAEILEYLRG